MKNAKTMKGGRVVESASAALDAGSRRTPLLAAFVTMAIAEWRTLVAQVARAVAGRRTNRTALESELFRGQYRLSSNNDDDLPVP